MGKVKFTLKSSRCWRGPRLRSTPPFWEAWIKQPRGSYQISSLHFLSQATTSLESRLQSLVHAAWLCGTQRSWPLNGTVWPDADNIWSSSLLVLYVRKLNRAVHRLCRGSIPCLAQRMMEQITNMFGLGCIWMISVTPCHFSLRSMWRTKGMDTRCRPSRICMTTEVEFFSFRLLSLRSAGGAPFFAYLLYGIAIKSWQRGLHHFLCSRKELQGTKPCALASGG